MHDNKTSFEEIGVPRLLRAVAFAVGLPAFMVGTAVFMLGFSLKRPEILTIAATLHGVAMAALLWWVLSRIFPVSGLMQGLRTLACMLTGAILWRAGLIWMALSLLHGES